MPGLVACLRCLGCHGRFGCLGCARCLDCHGCLGCLGCSPRLPWPCMASVRVRKHSSAHFVYRCARVRAWIRLIHRARQSTFVNTDAATWQFALFTASRPPIFLCQWLVCAVLSSARCTQACDILATAAARHERLCTGNVGASVDRRHGRWAATAMVRDGSWRAGDECAGTCVQIWL